MAVLDRRSAISSTALRPGSLATLLVCLFVGVAQAQTPPATTPPQQTFSASPEWGKLPRMQIERQYAGPLQDTIIQRLKDPVDGTVCYLYLPISAPHTPVTPSGFVQYGSTTIGSMSCMPGKR